MTRISTLLLFALTALAARPQGCDTVFIGTADTVSMGPETTPFPTGPFTGIGGAGGGRNAKVQYLFTAAELMAWGCALDAIQGIGLDILDTDIEIPPPGASLIGQVSVKNTITSSLTAYEETGLTLVAQFSTAGFDTVPPYETVLQQGPMLIGFDTPFQWNGTMNLVVEICWMRTAITGLSPRVPLDTGFTFQSTFYGMDAGPGIGCNMSMGIPATAYQGSNNTRPVFKLYTVPVSSTYPGSSVTALSDGTASDAATLHPNPTSGMLTISRSALREDDRRVELIDATGRLVLSQLIEPTGADPVMAIEALPPGAYVVRVQGTTGERRSLGTAMVE